MKLQTIVLLTAALFVSAVADAAVIQLGKVEHRQGMSIRVLSIQEVMMSHGGHAGHDMGAMADPSQPPGMHLEAKIFMEEEGRGFPPGSWVPYLGVQYRLTKQRSDWSAAGLLIPMLANDGPHYGANVPMQGPGSYRLEITLTPPEPAEFPIHMDRETGVDGWWQPFTLGWDFAYFGVGKKGGY